MSKTSSLRATRNHDLLRGSFQGLDRGAVAKAMLWLRGEGPFPPPTSVHLDLTLRCTARCLHCQQWSWPAQEELDEEQLRSLFAAFVAWGVRTITFGGGNPLLHAHFAAALRMAGRAGMQVSIISEGSGMSAETADAICADAQWIRFSLDGPRAEVHDRVRGTPGLFDHVVADVRTLKARQSALRVGLNCVVQRQNAEFMPEMLDLALRLGVDVLLFKVPHGDDDARRFLPTPGQWEGFVSWVRANARDDHGVQTNLPELARLLGPVFRAEDVTAGRPVRGYYREARVRCFSPLFFLVCNSRGDVFPCDYLQADTRAWKGRYGEMRRDFRVGNVLEDGPAAVLEKLAQMVRGRVRDLPSQGFDECGCCTRFCQLNAQLSEAEDELAESAPDVWDFGELLERLGAGSPQSPFL